MFYALRPDMLRFGSNRVTFQSPQGGRVTHVELHVKYGTAP